MLASRLAILRFMNRTQKHNYPSVFRRSRPVVNMTIAETTFETDNKLVSLDDRKCTLPSDGRRVTCTKVNSCLGYNGINLPTFIGKFEH